MSFVIRVVDGGYVAGIQNIPVIYATVAFLYRVERNICVVFHYLSHC